MEIRAAESQNQELKNQNLPVNTQEASPSSSKDPSFNCTSCNGEGLLGDPSGIHQVCPECNGTGKV